MAVAEIGHVNAYFRRCQNVPNFPSWEILASVNVCKAPGLSLPQPFWDILATHVYYGNWTFRKTRPDGETKSLTQILGNGLDYHFITRNEFDESIAAGAFLEYGMNKSGALYGTLLAEVDKIIQDNRIPLLCPPPQSLEKIKNKKYKAHVVFLKVCFGPDELGNTVVNLETPLLTWKHEF